MLVLRTEPSSFHAEHMICGAKLLSVMVFVSFISLPFLRDVRVLRCVVISAILLVTSSLTE